EPADRQTAGDLRAYRPRASPQSDAQARRGQPDPDRGGCRGNLDRRARRILRGHLSFDLPRRPVEPTIAPRRSLSRAIAAGGRRVNELASLILVNGRVRTLAGPAVARAVTCASDRILTVDTDDQALALRSPKSEVVDL